jgi:hypothetical protein
MAPPKFSVIGATENREVTVSGVACYRNNNLKFGVIDA